MLMFLFSFLVFNQFAHAEEKILAVPSQVEPSSKADAADSAEEGEYEIDYEEEPEEEIPVQESPALKKDKKQKSVRGGGGPAVQGSRAKDRFVPILKSESKSIYKKDGKVLDVDSD